MFFKSTIHDLEHIFHNFPYITDMRDPIVHLGLTEQISRGAYGLGVSVCWENILIPRH